MRTVSTIGMKRYMIPALVGLVLFAGSASMSRAGVTTVQMKIDGYLCGN